MSRIRVVLLAVLALAAPSPAPAQDDWNAVKKEVAALWADANPEKKLQAVRMLGQADRVEATRMLLALLGQKVPVAEELLKQRNQLESQRQALLRQAQVVTQPGGTSRRVFTPELKAKYDQVRAEIAAADKKIAAAHGLPDEVVAALGKTRKADALEHLHTTGLAHASWEVRAGVLAALGQAGQEASRPHVRKKIADPDPRVAAPAIDAAARLKDAEALPAITGALRNKEWQVKAAAVAALGQLGGKDSVEPLVEALKGETGRLRDDIDLALSKITGVTMGGDPKAWRSWLDANKARLAEVIAEHKKRPAKAGEQGKGNTVTFYGIQTNSKRICFVIDVSGSMSEKAAKTAGPAVSGRPADYPVDGTKLDVAKYELAQFIKRLPPDAWFNIVYYHTTVGVYQTPGLVPAKPGEKLKALDWIARELKVRGATNIHDALVKAFTLAAPDSDDKANLREGVDTVFFLTDGMPTAGLVRNTGEILKDIARRNRTRKVKIHAVAVGDTSNASFMKALAEQNGGTYVHHK